jgi:hypothetical protein
LRRVGFWLVDRYAPGLAVSATWMPFRTVALYLLHLSLKGHITRTADRQTATLTAGRSCDHGTEEEALMTETAAPSEPLATPDPRRPHFGFTRHHGFAVHARTTDHLQPHPDDGWYAGLNKRAALFMMKTVFTMTSFWVFTVLCLLVLPSVLYAMGIRHLGVAGFQFPTWFVGFGFELLATWFLSTFLELVLIPALGVGQNLQNAAADARAAKQFEDTEVIVDRLDVKTEGGIKAVLDAVNALAAKVDQKGAAS